MKNSEYLDERFIKTKNKIRKIIVYKEGNNELKNKHIMIAAFLKNNFRPSIFSKAYIERRSIIDNAKAHMYNNYFIMCDVKDFFNSISLNILRDKIYYELNKKTQISRIECTEIVSQCSINKRGLPLGLIPSPILSNIYMKEFDNILYGKLKHIGLSNIIYTRYADDIIISFSEYEISDEKYTEIFKLIKDTLKRFRLYLNDKKTRRYSFSISNHVKITGINLIRDNDDYRKITVGRKEKDKLYNDAIRCVEKNEKSLEMIQQIKGMQSFILSVEGREYEECYSVNMLKYINDKGFKSLYDLINSL
jgi:hypothetical protein